MSPATHSLEQNRLEIILLAAGVLVLVLLFAMLIFVCVSLKMSSSPLARHKATAWGGSWNDRWDAGPSVPYRDENSHDNVRRRSVSIAEDIRKKLTSLKQLMTLNAPDHGITSTEQHISSSLYNDATVNVGDTFPRSQHMLDNDGPSWHDLDSPASSTGTGRYRDDVAVIKRPDRVIVHHDDCDLEAQDSEDSEH